MLDAKEKRGFVLASKGVRKYSGKDITRFDPREWGGGHRGKRTRDLDVGVGDFWIVL